MEEKITDIEGLAALIQRTMASKKDFSRLEQKVDGLEQKMEDGFRSVNARLDIIREDISDLPAIRHELQDLRQRVKLLEEHAGITK